MEKFSLKFRIENKLFNGYVREPIPIFIICSLILLAFWAIAGHFTWAYIQLLSEPQVDPTAIQNAKKSFIIFWSVTLSFSAFCGVSYWILCHAERFPRLAGLLIRKEYRYF